MYWWRKNEKRLNIFTQYRMRRYTKKYGLEISKNAIIGEGIYLGHPYNITVAEGVKIGKMLTCIKDAQLEEKIEENV